VCSEPRTGPWQVGSKNQPALRCNESQWKQRERKNLVNPHVGIMPKNCSRPPPTLMTIASAQRLFVAGCYQYWSYPSLSLRDVMQVRLLHNASSVGLICGADELLRSPISAWILPAGLYHWFGRISLAGQTLTHNHNRYLETPELKQTSWISKIIIVLGA